MAEACKLSSIVCRLASEKEWIDCLPSQRHEGPFESVAKQRLLPSETINFRFRTRLIYATATINYDYPNVLRLQVQSSIIDRIMDRLLGHLPTSWRDRVSRFFPEWSLPSRLVLKVCKENWDEEFKIEKSTYKALESLQGSRIPNFYGELKYNGKKAILISDIGGVCLSTPEGALLKLSDVLNLVKDALIDLFRFGIEPCDIKLDNFRLVDGRIMPIDFEMVDHNRQTDEKRAEAVLDSAYFLGDQYEKQRSCYLGDGLIKQVK
ncbi:uncharacterized protein UV8b_07660 [Ustilaginoidea virens]|uniref:Protein kinase domain-containing protein n=1 Tax=Ustilaginoidea virens TaxID=1159556 RepID=A0A8E5HXG0_USTVR|nr:uncharacterized protein UV8b_07660 [Ustilaginoidea virens]QUC23419.1 hypothetical protein UV8b_07660 [Ustilaginoidea virens]